METILYNDQGKETGKVDLPAVFETKISPALLHEVVVGYMANQRAGNSSTKTRAEVSGGGRKPWKEKGTGNARAGSNRSPLWRKGGIIFGPKPRSYYQNLPQQKRRLALHMALTAKAQDGNVSVVDKISIDEPKTKKMAAILKNLKAQAMNVLLVMVKVDPFLRTASRNIDGLVITPVDTINTYQVLWANKIIFTPDALEYFNKIN